jgi:hypothetical protein
MTNPPPPDPLQLLDPTDPAEPPLRRAWLGGVRREDAEALQQELTETRARLATTTQALEESTTWAERLPAALADLARLAAADSAWEDPETHFAVVIKDLAGHHLLAEVEIVSVYADSPTEQDQRTEWRTPNHPQRTDVRVGTRLCRCTWANTAAAGEETTTVIESLCRAVLFSLAGLDVAGERDQRWIVTQMADGRAYTRAMALRERLAQPTATVTIHVDEASAGEHYALYGQIAWEASFADAGAVIEEVANRASGQAYQTHEYIFALVLDPAHAHDAETELRERLADRELRFHVRQTG